MLNALLQLDIRQAFESTVSAEALSSSLWYIILLPLLGAAVCGLFGRWLGRSNVNLIACGTVAGAFVLSLLSFIVLNDARTEYMPAGMTEPVRYAMGHDYGTWFQAGSFSVHFGLMVDHLSGTLLLVITGVGFLIHLYSTAYMEHDAGYWRYFAYLNLFVAMMLTLVMGDNLVLTFVGWEGVGFCSYLLIGFWYTDEAKAWAGRKAFITNRIGDFAFVIGMMLLTLLVGAYEASHKTGPNFGDNSNVKVVWDRAVDPTLPESKNATGPLSYANLQVLGTTLHAHASDAGVTLASEMESGPLRGLTYGGVLTAIMFLFLIGAAGKSAQLPLYVWLPDAMAGPTPVSALIHAATMVTAGVYLFCRLSFLLVLAPKAMAAVALVGAATALFAALIAFAQDDIKKVLAYSTVSQLGFMFMAVGMGVFWAAVLHLVTHAFFKACLFLGAGSVMHGNGDETDIKKLGGLRKEMKWTWLTFLIATLAITGLAPLSGFFSKDAILHGVSETVLSGVEWVRWPVWIMGLLAALGTAFYMTRLYWLTFEGKRSKDAKLAHAHESSWPMTLPLIILAALSIAAFAHGFPRLIPEMASEDKPYETLMENFLRPVFAVAENITKSSGFIEEKAPFGLTGLPSLLFAFGLAWVLALVGSVAAWFAYTRYFPSREGARVPPAVRGVRSFAQHKFYVDELYEAVIINPVRATAQGLYKVFDTYVIDGTVRLVAWGTLQVGSALRHIQTGDAQNYAAMMAVGLLAGGLYALVLVLR